MIQNRFHSRDELRVKPMSTEDMIKFQLDRINAIRVQVDNPSRIDAWSEALEAMHDRLIPWHDDEFKTEWAACGKGFVVGPRGKKFYLPSAQDCRERDIAIMGLLNRCGLLVRKRNISGPGPREWEVEGVGETGTAQEG